MFGELETLRVLHQFDLAETGGRRLLFPSGLARNGQGDWIVTFPYSHRVNVYSAGGEFKHGIGGRENKILQYPCCVAHCVFTGKFASFCPKEPRKK